MYSNIYQKARVAVEVVSSRRKTNKGLEYFKSSNWVMSKVNKPLTTNNDKNVISIQMIQMTEESRPITFRIIAL